MRKTLRSNSALLVLLRREVERAGSQNALAKEFGIGAAYLSDVLNGRREAGPAILAGLGLKREVRYVEAE